MRIKRNGTTVKLWLSVNDTYNWAHRPGARWPCSQLAGKRLFAKFDDGDLVEYTVNGLSVDIPRDEFTAITDDFIGGRYYETGHRIRRTGLCLRWVAGTAMRSTPSGVHSRC